MAREEGLYLLLTPHFFLSRLDSNFYLKHTSSLSSVYYAVSSLPHKQLRFDICYQHINLPRSTCTCTICQRRRYLTTLLESSPHHIQTTQPTPHKNGTSRRPPLLTLTPPNPHIPYSYQASSFSPSTLPPKNQTHQSPSSLHTSKHFIGVYSTESILICAK